MSIDYYLADKKHRQLFDVGTHKHEYARMLRRALGGHEEPPFRPTRADFCLAVAAEAAWRVPAGQPDYCSWAALQAERIWNFAESRHWDVELVNDCDDTLFRYDGCEVIDSVYSDFTTPYRIGAPPESAP